MSSRIRIDPGDLRQAARTYSDSCGALADVRSRLTAPPPEMPAHLESRAASELSMALRDLAEQRAYLKSEAAALQRRARLAELAGEGGMSPFAADLAELFSPVPMLGARFKMPEPPKPKKRASGTRAVPGFFNGFGNSLKSTATGAADMLSMAWDAKKRREFEQGMKHAYKHPGQAVTTLFDELTARKDRENGRPFNALGNITGELLTTVVPPLKLRHLKRLQSDAEDNHRSTQRSSDDAGDRARDAERRLADGPRWRSGEVPWSPSGAAPGRWANPQEFRDKIVTPAKTDAADARRRTDAAEREFVGAALRYDKLWVGNAAVGAADAAAKLDKMSDELNRKYGRPGG